MFDSQSYLFYLFFFLFQEEDGIRGQPRFRGRGDVYKRQQYNLNQLIIANMLIISTSSCHLYTSDAADELTRIDVVLRGTG